MNISDTHTWVASPTKASLQSSMDLPSGKFSIMVMRSPSSWVGWLYSLMPLITGAAEYLARSTTSLWRSTRAMRMSTRRPHDAPGVLDGLVAAQLDGAGAEELGVAAQVGHGRLEGDAGAGGHLLEDHAEGLVLQQQRVLAALLDELLHGDGEVHHAEQLLLGEVVGVDVILDHGNPPWTRGAVLPLAGLKDPSSVPGSAGRSSWRTAWAASEVLKRNNRDYFSLAAERAASNPK